MPCPHFSNLTGECVLQQERVEEDDPRELRVEDPTSRDWCLSATKDYQNCPLFKRFLLELLP